MAEQTSWHWLFGLFLMDFFAGTPFTVEVEKDLSHQAQYLDVVVVRRGEGEPAEALPDGLHGHLVEHNLITFKSYQDALSDYSLKELTGHYVKYHKLVSPSHDDLIPEGRLRMFAVCARFPQGLSDEVPLTEVGPGVYDCRRGTDVIRVVVTGRLPLAERNAMLHLFDAQEASVRYGMQHFRQRDETTSSLLQRLLFRYHAEGRPMPYTLEEFRREFVENDLRTMFTVQERLAGIPAEEVLRALPVEDVLRALTPEMLEALRQRLKDASPPEPPRG